MTTSRINQVAFLGMIGTTHGRYENPWFKNTKASHNVFWFE